MISPVPDDAPLDLSHTPIRMSGPEDLLDLVPYVLGFHPRDSLVLVALERHAPGRGGADTRRLGAAARLDLAAIELDPGCLDRVMQAVGRGASALVAIVYYDEPATDPLPAAAVVEELERIAADAGIELLDALLARGARWWSYLCSDPACCPIEGRQRRAEPTAAVAAAAYAGLSVLPDREALDKTLDPAPLADREARRALIEDVLRGWAPTDRARAKRALYARVRQRSVEGTLDFVPPRLLPERQIAEFAVALLDVEVRDACWLAMEGGRLPDSSLWIELARALPPPYDAAPMFLHAWQSWRRGRGALAAMAAARALDSDPQCSAAQLLLDSIAHGLDPRRTPRLRGGRRPAARGRDAARRRAVRHRAGGSGAAPGGYSERAYGTTGAGSSVVPPSSA